MPGSSHIYFILCVPSRSTWYHFKLGKDAQFFNAPALSCYLTPRQTSWTDEKEPKGWRSGFSGYISARRPELVTSIMTHFIQTSLILFWSWDVPRIYQNNVDLTWSDWIKGHDTVSLWDGLGWDGVGWWRKRNLFSVLQYCLMRHLRLIAGVKGKHDCWIDYGLASQTIIKPHSGLWG